MPALVPLALFGWLLVSLALFAALPGRRAAIICAVAGTLFLPVGGFLLPGLPDYAKGTAVAVGLVLGVVLMDSSQLSKLRVRWFDIPVLGMTALPIATSLSNGLGPLDGISAAYGDAMMWGVPYFVGRLYVTCLDDMHDVTVGFVLGALVYVPLCLLEVRLSPQLHYWVYGYYPGQFIQSRRYGGFRPTVFMNHGLAVAGWISLATVTALWLRASGRIRRLWGLPASAVIAALLVTIVLCKSFGPIILLAVGAIVLAATRARPRAWLLLAIVVTPLAYTILRIVGVWSWTEALDGLAATAGEDRAGSLRIRVESEAVLIEHALARPFLGWGGWGRNRPKGQEELLTDGLWVIVFAQGGLLRLVAYLGTMLLPAARLAWRLPASVWLRPRAAPAVAAALVTALLAVDCTFNAGVNPFFFVLLGGVASAADSLPPRGARAFARRRPQGTANLQNARRGGSAPRPGATRAD